MATWTDHAKDRKLEYLPIVGRRAMIAAERKASKCSSVREVAVITPLPRPVKYKGQRRSSIVCIVRDNAVITVKLLTSGQLDIEVRHKPYVR